MIISNRQKQTLVNMPPNPVYKCWQKKQLNVTTFALFLTLWVCFSSLSYLVYFKPVSQSRKAENMPDAVSNIFFFLDSCWEEPDQQPTWYHNWSTWVGEQHTTSGSSSTRRFGVSIQPTSGSCRTGGTTNKIIKPKA